MNNFIAINPAPEKDLEFKYGWELVLFRGVVNAFESVLKELSALT